MEDTPDQAAWRSPEDPVAPSWSGGPSSPIPPAPDPGWGPPPQAAGWGQPEAWAVPARPKPGIVPLRPITLGEIYDGAFQAMRSNPRTMIGVSAVVITITTLITLVPQTASVRAIRRFGAAAADPTGLGPTTEDLAAAGAGLVGTLFAALVQGLAVTVLTGLLIVAVSEAVLGRTMSAGQVWKRAKGRVWALLGLAVITGTLIMIGTLLLIVPGVLLYVGWSMAAPAMLLEEQSIGAAIRRSWRLTRGSFWRVFGILLLTAIIVALASALIVTPLTIVSAVIDAGAGGTPSTGLLFVEQAVQQLGSAVAGSIFYPFQAAVSALLYIDLRMRREGLDVELIRASEDPPG